ncbi:TetR/AcrR family transcriptional regulator [Burkholderia alba]|uniref:TetR/AcrR family transcriptional regulator n=1 Tax=Burkholderia alba TaxID=2683677 RepID=UPI002B054A7A|nr:TetR/AcrR family transcriptional regulator [Burkholderia alba]
MSSQKSTGAPPPQPARAKQPQRERGRARVAALLEAAGAEFAQKGYEGATMTAIAARAGASIGSLYQFFPTKPQVAAALLDHYLERLAAAFRALREQAASMPLPALAEKLTRSLVKFRATHPAFVMLAETYGHALPGVGGIRQRVRGEIASVLAELAPDLAPDALDLHAAVVQQLMKAAVALNSDTSFKRRDAAIVQLEALMLHYLSESVATAV